MRKFVSLLALVSILFNSLSTPIIAFAQEVTPMPTMEPEVVEESPSPEPTVQPTVEPTTEPTQEPTNEPVIVEESSPSPEPTIEASTEPTQEPEQENQNTTNENAETLAPPSTSPSSEPETVEVLGTSDEGTITTEVVQNENPFPVTVYNNEWFKLTTDKLDYAPTETAIITGSDFTPNKTYEITVSSLDDPATSTTDEVITDSEGKFVYYYQLDGIYRPNYSVEVRDGSLVVATVTFTDSASVAAATGGTGISGVKAQNGSAPEYTTLSNIVIDEGVDTDFAANQSNTTLILTTPTNWTFEPGVGTVSHQNGRDITSISISVTSTTITVTLSTDSTSDKDDKLTISGIKVRAIDGTIIPSDGNILRTVGNSGTATIAGVTNGITNFGSLSQIAAPVSTPTPTPTPPSGGNQSADLDQYANDAPEEWVNGNLGASKATYYEGDSVPYRMKFGNLSLSSHVVVIEWDTSKSDKHATDYLTTYNRSVASADPCEGVVGCGAPTTFAIPNDPQVTGAGVTPIPGNFTLFGGTITGVSAYSYPSGVGFVGDKSAQIAITFTATQSNPVLAWSGHIGTRGDWGNGNSAVNIPGSPYHMRLIDLDGSGGNQDRSLSADAVIYPALLNITKDALPDSAQDFAFTTTGTGLNNFSLDDDADGTLPNTTQFSITEFGSKTVTENLVSGWSLTGLTCNDSNGSVSLEDRSATLDLSEGEVVDCTFTNTLQNGTLIVQKTTIPSADETEFTINTTGTGNIVGGGSGVITDAQDKSYTVEAGTYSVAETVPTGWSKTGDTCQNVVVTAGQTSTCTITNTKLGKIIVEKQTDPDGSTQMFGFQADYGPNFELSDGQINDSGFLEPGTGYSVSEDPESGWDLTSATCDDGSNPSNIDLSAGEVVTCTFNNQQDANIVVVKQTDPDGNQTSFEFDTDYSTNFSLSDGQSNDSGDLNPGVYSVSEIVPLLGWDLTSATCDDGSDVSGINLQAGETVTCTFINTQRGSVSGYKFEDLNGNIADNTDQTPVEGLLVELWKWVTDSFVFESDTYTNSSGFYEFTNLLPGVYQVREIVSSLVGSWMSLTDDSLDVTLDPGEVDDENNFVNVEYGSIVVVKQTNPDGSPENFEFDASYHNDNFLLTDGFFDLSGDLLPGNYSVAELPEAGWDLTSATCDDGSSPLNISLQSGETVTCTFTNTQKGHLIVEKTTIPENDSQVFGITATGSGVITGGGAGTVSDSQDENYEVTPGTYSVTESVPGSWVETSNNCSGIEVSAGETEYCQIVNTKRGNVTVTKYHDHNANRIQDQDDETLDGWEIQLGSSSQFTGAQEEGQVTFSDMASGEYTLSETIQEGWFQSNIACSDTDQIDNNNDFTVTVNPGETTLCSIGNYQKGSIQVFKNIDTDGDGDVDVENSDDWLWELGTLDYQTGRSAVEVNPGQYNISEFQETGYHVLDLTCSDGGSLGATESTQLTVSSNEDIVCTFTNARNTGGIKVTKIIDADGNAETTEDQTLGAEWQFDVDGTDGDTTDALADSTDENGEVTFNLLKTGEYTVVETIKNGYELLTASCGENGTFDQTDSVDGVNVTKDSVVNCTFINFLLSPDVEITKSNNNNEADNGETVGYTLNVTNNGNVALSDVTVYDALPGGFSYILGTSKVDGLEVSDPTQNGNTLIWNIGSLSTNQTKVVTYDVVIGDSVTDGSYKNLATCTAGVARLQESIECNVVESTVTIGSGLGYGGSLTGQVLGASIELPATGSSTWILALALSGLVGGTYMLYLDRKKKYAKN